MYRLVVFGMARLCTMRPWWPNIVRYCCARLKTRTCSFLNLASTTSLLTAVSSPLLVPRSPHVVVVEAVCRELPAPMAALAVLPNTPGTKALQNLFARVHDTNTREANCLTAGGAPRKAFILTGMPAIDQSAGLSKWPCCGYIF